jgi:hypothetical protein
MYLWRSLPEGQLLAVLRWMSTRRERPAAGGRPGEATSASAEAGEKAVSPLR